MPQEELNFNPFKDEEFFGMLSWSKEYKLIQEDTQMGKLEDPPVYVVDALEN